MIAPSVMQRRNATVSAAGMIQRWIELYRT